jgi:protein-L-isoaspartate(D-aspartate) O-methyltransferase
MKHRVILAIGVCLCLAMQVQGGDDPFAAAREKMLAAIQATVIETRRETGKSALAPRVMDAMGTVLRHEFVPDELEAVAYANRPLPVGHGQTISQPYIVALMTDLLDVDDDAVVLELGTGSGYQAAVLAELVSRVYTMEIIEPLAASATERLARLGYGNVEVKFADGYFGWPEKGPFDAIIVTAAASHIPPPLVEQLRPGGRLVVPVGERFAVQHLLLVHKLDEERVQIRQILPVRFVPLTGGHG